MKKSGKRANDEERNTSGGMEMSRRECNGVPDVTVQQNDVK